MIKLLVVADDFTGALDTGVQFSKKKISTLVSLNLDISPMDLKEDVEVLVIDTESRHLSKEAAYQRVYNIVKKFKDAGVNHFYKKVDSTLRGNIGVEIKGFMDGVNTSTLSMIPAFPNGNRTTENGNQYVEGILLEDSVFSKDPFHPSFKSFIPAIISSQVEMNTKITGIENESILFDRTDSFYTVEIYDGKANEDLKRWGEHLQRNKKLNYTCGCAGFAEVLSEIMDFNEKEEEKSKFSKNILFVCGSVNQISLDQTSYAKRRGYFYHTLTPEQNISDEYRNKEEYKNLIQKVVKELKEKDKFLIETLDNYEKLKLTEKYLEENKINGEHINLKIAKNMGGIIKDIVDASKIENIVVFGGDTIKGISEKLECIGIQPLREISPGVVHAKLLSSFPRYNLNIFTKAGGFGKKSIIDEIEKYIRD